MRSHITIYKRRGETPLAAIETWKKAHPRYAFLRASYAGRLDPLAEGKLLVLFGDECKKQRKYTKLDKEYEIKVVLDLSTDTGDVLGLPSYANKEIHPTYAAIQTALKNASGTHRVPYPNFSSKPVNGKPLFMYALEGTLGSIQIPEHDETIYRLSLLSVQKVSITNLQHSIADALQEVPRSNEPSKALGADFRQEVIRAGWKVLFDAIPDRTFTVVRLRVTCASGTYMRSLAERLGAALGTTAFAFSIKRLRIGKFQKLGPFGLWLTSY